MRRGVLFQAEGIVQGEGPKQGFLMAQMIKNPPSMQETQIQFLVGVIPGEGNGNSL